MARKNTTETKPSVPVSKASGPTPPVGGSQKTSAVAAAPQDSQTAGSAVKSGRFVSSAEIMTLPKGLYSVSIRGGAAVRSAFPAAILAPAPGESSNNVDFIVSPYMDGPWLRATGDMVIVRAMADETNVLLSSIRLPEMAPLQIGIQRLDTRPGEISQPQSPTAIAVEGPASIPARAGAIHFRLIAHIQNRGDVTFEGASPAGFPGKREAIEGFAIVPFGDLLADQIEYKAVDSRRNETAWIPGGNFCGSRGKGVPLTGFCIRIKPQPDGREFDCTYSGLFSSGRVVGPVKNGTPCWSPTAGDFLEALAIEIVARTAPAGGKGRPQ